MTNQLQCTTGVFHDSLCDAALTTACLALGGTYSALITLPLEFVSTRI